jgi:hypothetical protein
MPKMTGDEKRAFLLNALEEQRHLMEKSIKDFESGDLTEALRLATTIRVLVHETSSSKPLLAQLMPNHLDLKIFTSVPHLPEAPPNGAKRAIVMFVPIATTISDKGVFFNAERTTDGMTPVILGAWWSRPSLILPGIGGITRKEIVLGLANKEGGAHVDVDLSRRYAQLLASKQLQIGNGTETTPLNLSRFMVAQSAIELLNCIDTNFPSKTTVELPPAGTNDGGGVPS